MKQKIVILYLFFLKVILFAQPEYDLRENIKYYDGEGNGRCVLDIYYPKNIDNYPTIVWFHGGGLKRGNKYISDRLKNQEVAIVSANYRFFPNVSTKQVIEDAAEAFSKWSNLIGDPALHLWSSVPVNFDFSHVESIALGTTLQDFTIIDENGDAVDGAKVTLLMGDDVIFATGYTDEDGQVTLSWDAVETGTMSLVVIKHNYKPYEGSIEITDVAGAAVSITSEELFVNSVATSSSLMFYKLHHIL